MVSLPSRRLSPEVEVLVVLGTLVVEVPVRSCGQITQVFLA
jgi:hypothetical protein